MFLDSSFGNQTSLIAQLVKNPRAMQETWVRSLGWEDPLEEGMAIHCNILVWRILMGRGAWWATGHGLQSQTQLSTAKMYLSRTGIVKESPNLSYKDKCFISVLFH